MRTFVLLTVLFSACAVGFAAPLWGRDGHAITAMVATGLLDSKVIDECNKILGDGQTIVDIASWADEQRDKWPWSAPLHYINTPDWACKYDPVTDCVDNVCVAGAIANYTHRLLTQSDPDQVSDALKFLVHFHGDIHQPLHVGFGSDKGGNSIEGTFNGYHDNLHAIWDEWILDEDIKKNFGGDKSQYAQDIVSRINGEWSSKAKAWETCSNNSTAINCPAEWANVSADLACQYSYTDSTGAHIENGFNLGTPYYDFTKDVVREQLAKSGVRMAKSLTLILQQRPRYHAHLPRDLVRA